MAALALLLERSAVRLVAVLALSMAVVGLGQLVRMAGDALHLERRWPMGQTAMAVHAVGVSAE
jgi:hypothetical protein